MKKSKVLSFALVMTLILAVLAGCSANVNITDSGEPQNGGNTASASNGAEKVNTNVAELLTSVDKDYDFRTADGGIYYQDKSSGKYGIMSLDGTSDTGAKYYYVHPMGKFFQVVTNEPTDTTFKALNCYGVVDGSGREIAPEQYFTAEAVGDNFVQVCEATEETDSKDDALVFYHTGDGFVTSFTPADDDLFFKGVWYIYDAATGQKIEGATGTNAYSVTNYGEWFSFYNDSDKQVYMNAKGETLPKNARLLTSDFGYYTITEGKEGTLYDGSGKVMYTYSTDGFTPGSSIEGDYIMTSRYADGKFCYQVADLTGKAVSVEFEGSAHIDGNFVVCDNKVYDFEGNQVGDQEYTSVICDENCDDYFVLSNSGKYTLVDKDGKVLCSTLDEGVDSVYYNYLFSKGTDYFCMKDNDFTIDGTSFSPWVVKTSNDDYTASLIDVRTGEFIAENYEDFDYVNGSEGYFFYGTKANGGLDVIKLK